MGNQNNKSKSFIGENQENRQYSSQFSLLSSLNHLNWSSRESQRALSVSNRPWSRVSRRKWKENTLNNPIEQSKTCWPVPFIESIFLPHFKIQPTNLEDNFKIIENFACGGFGKVCRVIEKSTNKEFALKSLSKAQIIKDGTSSQIRDEVDIQSIIGHHPFIVQCVSYWQSRKQIFILSEYIPCGELFDKIKEFPYQLIQIYVAEIAIALEFIHNAGIIYRDLKPENILLDNNYNIKITDFGLSKWLRIGERTRTICGTLQYMAPEILSGEFYGHAVDWWALGVLSCRMMVNKYPSIGNMNNEKVNKCSNDETSSSSSVNKEMSGPSTLCAVKNDDEVSPIKLIYPQEIDSVNTQSKDLLNRLLEINPKYRLKSLLGLERIAMFKGFNFDEIREKKISPKEILNSYSMNSTSQDITTPHTETEQFIGF